MTVVETPLFLRKAEKILDKTEADGFGDSHR